MVATPRTGDTHSLKPTVRWRPASSISRGDQAGTGDYRSAKVPLLRRLCEESLTTTGQLSGRSLRPTIQFFSSVGHALNARSRSANPTPCGPFWKI
jgi:hypothetical protein